MPTTSEPARQRHSAASRRAAGALGLAAIAVAVGLLLAGLRRVELRAFVLRTQTAGVVATATARAAACEGPVRTPEPVRRVVIYGVRHGDPEVRIVVRATDGRIVASGPLPPGASAANMDPHIPAATPVRVCVTARNGTLDLLGGSNGSEVSRHFSTTGVARGQVFALLLERPSSLLGALGTAFSRAAIFRPSWVGAWTFWLLLALLGCTLPLAGLALVRAVRADDADES